jgi:hypothetical protein
VTANQTFDDGEPFSLPPMMMLQRDLHDIPDNPQDLAVYLVRTAGNRMVVAAAAAVAAPSHASVVGVAAAVKTAHAAAAAAGGGGIHKKLNIDFDSAVATHTGQHLANVIETVLSENDDFVPKARAEVGTERLILLRDG